MGDADGGRHQFIEKSQARMRHEELVVERIERGIECLLDRRKIQFAIFHGRVVAVYEYGSHGDQQKNSNVFSGQHSPGVGGL